jgi:isoamylase
MVAVRREVSGISRRGEDATVLLIYNSHFDVVNFTLPEVPEGLRWEGLVDTNQPDAHRGEFAFGTVFQVTGRSLLAFGLANAQVSR